MLIYDSENNQKIEVEIVVANRLDLPLKKDGWNFNWRQLFKHKNKDTEIYILRLKSSPKTIEGVLQLRKDIGMLIMDLIEIAPHNIGSKNKRYDWVAGCLIAFACRESIKIEGPYRGFLTFMAKTQLIKMYQTKYGAQIALGQRMFIDYNQSVALIDKYLKV